MKVGNTTTTSLAINKPGATNSGHAGTLHALDRWAGQRAKPQH
jgi:hypothetical protein